MQNKNTIKLKTLLAISNDKKCTYTSIQKHVLTAQGKDAQKEYKRGYYCTNICDWKYSKLIIKKGKFYRLTSLGKLYLKNPQKANDKIKINKLKARVNRFEDIAKYWFNKSKNIEKIEQENKDLSFKLNQCLSMKAKEREDLKSFNMQANYIDICFNSNSDFINLTSQQGDKQFNIIIEPHEFLHSFNKHQINRVKTEYIKQINNL